LGSDSIFTVLLHGRHQRSEGWHQRSETGISDEGEDDRADGAELGGLLRTVKGRRRNEPI